MAAENDTQYSDIENVESIIMVANVGPPAISDLSPNSDWKGTNNSSCTSCYGLPYQDHNYGAPPPATPPLSPDKPQTNRKRSDKVHHTPKSRLDTGGGGGICVKKQGRKRQTSRKEKTSNGTTVTDSAITNRASKVKHSEIATTATAVSTSAVAEQNAADLSSGTVTAAKAPVNCESPNNESDDTEPSVDVGNACGDDEDSSSDYGDSITRCICNFTHDDGYMICCDQCQVWQHIDCMGIDRENIPEEYSCEQCIPRKVSKARARMIQKRKRDLILQQENQRKADGKVDDSDNLHTESQLGCKATKPTNSKHRRFGVRNSLDHSNGTGRRLSTNSSFSTSQHQPAATPVASRRRQSRNGGSTETVFLSVDGDAEESPWTSSYELASYNQYSAEVDEAIKSAASDSLTEAQLQATLSELKSPRCQLKLLVNGKRGLEVETTLPAGVALIEFTGKVMLQHQYQQENDIYKRPQPFVLFYDGWDDHEICVDATTFGNAARFVRRSCVPNAQINHIIENGRLRLVLYSTKEVQATTEVTIPFDFDFKQWAQCPVRKAARKLMKNLSVPSAAGDGLKNEAKPCPIQPVVKKEAVESVVHDNHECNGAVKGHRRSTESIKSPKNENPEETKRMSREDRKIEAYMKAFEKMAKREERRKEAMQRQHERKDHHNQNQPQATHCDDTEATSTANNISQSTHMHPKAAHRRSRHKSATVGSVKSAQINPTAASLPTSEDDNSNSVSEAAIDSSSRDGLPYSFTSSMIPAPSEVGSTSVGTVRSSTCTFRPPKTKKDLLSEWYQEKGINKPLTVKTNDLCATTTHPPHPQESTDDNIDFVVTNHSPGSSFAHLRRNSMSTSHHSPAIPPKKLDTSMGSAKKRWLKQALEEVDTVQSCLSSPVTGNSAQTSPTGANAVPAALTNSNPVAVTSSTAGGSAFNNLSNDTPLSPMNHSVSNDFVTPLKKRRLVRESLSLDDNPLSPDNSHGATAIPILTQQQLHESGLSATTTSSSFVPPPDEAANHPLDLTTEAVNPPSACVADAIPQAAMDYEEQVVQEESSCSVPADVPELLQSAPAGPQEVSGDQLPLPVERHDDPSTFSSLAAAATTVLDSSSEQIPNSTFTTPQVIATAAAEPVVTPAAVKRSTTADSDNSCTQSSSDAAGVGSPETIGSPQKKKVSLQDYRNRLKVKASTKPVAIMACPSSESAEPCASTVSLGAELLAPPAADTGMSLPVLPLFNEKPDSCADDLNSSKPTVSLDERLAQVFGLSKSDTVTQNNNDDAARDVPPPPPPPSAVLQGLSNGLSYYPAQAVVQPAAGLVTSSPAVPDSHNPEDYTNNTTSPTIFTRTHQQPPVDNQQGSYPPYTVAGVPAVDAQSPSQYGNQPCDLLSRSAPSYLLKQGSIASSMFLGEQISSSLNSNLFNAKSQLNNIQLPRKYQHHHQQQQMDD